jgi:hypothetical protein
MVVSSSQQHLLLLNQRRKKAAKDPRLAVLVLAAVLLEGPVVAVVVVVLAAQLLPTPLGGRCGKASPSKEVRQRLGGLLAVQAFVWNSFLTTLTALEGGGCGTLLVPWQATPRGGGAEGAVIPAGELWL